ncbi:MAG TPA: tRNA (adenosine(37)-N6)-threonylcarbamoyltransferase complex dimerization subunit type 1 TsaB [Thermotogaceae bacterium]|nr:tRNA (adenosine(37)-N6)-threonylcarbamoyltransferase complex dimerization subunit type 1 TsaB [Thermotogaceae bacterium]
MKILALDTSTDRIVFGYKDETQSAEYSFEGNLRHSRTLMIKLDNFLASINIDINEIELFGCGIGPGSFTGLRIGIAAVKAMAYVNNRKIVGIPSLDLFALNVPFDGHVLVVKHARDINFYGALYFKKGNIVDPIISHFFKDKYSILEDLKHLEIESELFIIGDGTNEFRNLRDHFKVFECLNQQYNEIRGLYLVNEVERRYSLNEKIYDSKSLLPLYLQRPLAEINWEKRYGNKGAETQGDEKNG